MEEKLMMILNEICGAEDGELEPDMNLFEMGLLDSFGVVQLFVEIEEQFGVTLDIETVTWEEMATPALILERIKKAG